MSEGLKALKSVEKVVKIFYHGSVYQTTKYPKQINTIEKELKALELLLDKVLDTDGLNEYVDMFFEKCLINEEEYNLLKEVLK